MGPEEILSALDEAITKVQTNVLVFEKSCSEISEQTTFINGTYSEKTNDLLETLQGFEPDVQKLSKAVIDEVVEKAEAAKEEVSGAIDEFEGELESQIGDTLDTLTNAFDTTFDQANAYIDETVSKVEDITGEFKNVGESYNEALNSSLEKLGSVENQVQEQLSSFVETLSNELQSQHSDVLEEVNQFMDGALNSELVDFFGNCDTDFTGVGEELLDGLDNAGEMLSNKFEDLGMELIDYTDKQVTEEAKDVVNSIIDAIIGELAETISEAIIKSSVGVSVTGAASPMMPMLIAFNKIFDALEGAISAWKAFKDTFGM